MSAPGTPAPASAPAAVGAGSLLLTTIRADLSAGISWLEGEFEQTGLMLWNALKGAFIALEPGVASALIDGLTAAVSNAPAAHSIEDIEQAFLNTAKPEALAAAATAGSGAVQTVIAGLRTQFLPGLGGSAPKTQ